MSRTGVPSQLAVVTILGIGALLSLGARQVLPEQFLRDDAHIQRAILDPGGATHAESFRLIAAVYRSLGLAEAPSLAGLLGFGVFALTVAAALRWQPAARLGVLGFCLLGAMTGLALIYLAQYSKELLTGLLAVLIMLAPRARGGDLLILAACGLYAATVRPYWVLVAVLYLALRWLLARRTGILGLLALLSAFYILAAFAFRAAWGENLEGRRAWLNAERADTLVNTLITGPFPQATGVLTVVSTLLVLAALLVPVPLLLTGEPQQMLTAVVLTAVWLCVLAAALRLTAAQTARIDAHPRARRAAAVLLAFVAVQALFEPDYGSALKHLTPLLPLTLALVPLRPQPAALLGSVPEVGGRAVHEAVADRAPSVSGERIDSRGAGLRGSRGQA